MYKTKVISNFNLTERKERIPVLLIVLIYYIMVYFMYRTWNESYINLPNPFSNLMSFLFGGLVLITIAFFVSLKWKISLHSISISAMAGGFLALSLTMSPVYNIDKLILWNTLLLIVMGFVGSSRLYLKAHNTYEVLCGLLLGFGVEYIIVFYRIAI